MALSSSGGGSSKRASSSGGSEVVNNYKTVHEAAVIICVVDGCGADLSECRKYYQRHKVCEVHSKTPQVSIYGQSLRFCQQCSRFHSLDEFDDGKRSCRKRLDGHNRRRRKPRPYMFSPPHQGTNILQSAGPSYMHQTMGLVINPLWSDAPSCWVDQTNYAPSLLSSSSVSPPQSTVSHVMMHPQSGSSSGSGYITTAGPLNQQGLVVSGGLENDNCDMGWGGMTIDIDPRHSASLNHEDTQTLPFYWLYQ